MQGPLLLVLIAAPIVFGVLAFLLRPAWLRSSVVVLASVVTAAAGIALSWIGYGTYHLSASWSSVATGLELLIMAVVLVLGFKIRSWRVGFLALSQLIMAGIGLWLGRHEPHEGGAFVMDALSIMMVLIVSIIGSLIAIYGIGYMKKHEHHAPPTAASTGRFFFFIVAFLGLMNGLVLTDNLKWLSFFWECTTLCSFFLIGHDGTDEAKRNARKALIINTLGGAAMTLGALLVQIRTGSESISGSMSAAVLLPMALLSFAALTKSAQMPFQSWLLGAMVAPTPVSALLHSSTMVKAGSYLILRLAPSFGDTALAPILAMAGAFTFAVACALAISQSNGKKVLAYSTIANLGLIVACAGLNSPMAYAAALVILCFHAVSKALLFLCVGTVEQAIASREIEDMSGILYKMPLTTSIAALGMASMVVPPFGMLIGKWMAIEAAVNHPLVLVFLVIGSALTVFFWAKWIGRITTVSYHPEYKVEKVSFSMLVTLVTLIIGVVVMAVLAMPMYHMFIKPMSLAAFPAACAGAPESALMRAVDQLVEWPLFAILFFVVVGVWVSLARFKKEHVKLPFLCGENAEDETISYEFKSLMDQKNTAYVTSYYLAPIFGEAAITAWANPVAVMILLVLFGVILK